MNLNGSTWPVDKFRSNSPLQPRIAAFFHCTGIGSRSFRETEIRYDSVMKFLFRSALSLTVLLALSAASTRQTLAEAGFRVRSVALDAIEAAGGSLRCCVAEVF